MPLFRRRPPELKHSRAAAVVALTTAGRPQWTPRDYAALALRPLSPVHLRVATVGGDVHIGWVRRPRVGGDGWAAEVPLGEEREAYRLRVLDGETVVRTLELDAPAFVYTAAMRAADFPGGPGGVLGVEVAQGSAIYGWGAGSQRLL